MTYPIDFSSSLHSSSRVVNSSIPESLITLPIDVLLLILSDLKVSELIRISYLNKYFYQLSQHSTLWKKLTLTIGPDIKEEKDINWKNTYKNELNFTLFRKRTCSIIANTRPCFYQQYRPKTFSIGLVEHFLSFDEKGRIKAICLNHKVQEVFNVHGQITQIELTEWQVRTFIHLQFIHFAIFDGSYNFIPHIKLEIINPLNRNQELAFQYLKQRIKTWLNRCTQDPHLDEYVKNTMRNSIQYKQQKINCIRDTEKQLTKKHKAYFVLFRACLENPPIQDPLKPTTSYSDKIHISRAYKKPLIPYKKKP